MMAGNKMNKTKGKEDKYKSSKDSVENDEEIEEPDHALLRKPILTSVTGFRQARKIYDWATEELKHLLSNECDILYECKVCRNIFRSLANFISHKRVYCKENFNPNAHSTFRKSPSTISELLRIKHVEEEYQDSLNENVNKKSNYNNEDDQIIPLTKDLTEIVEKVAIKNGVQNCPTDMPQTVLQEIPNTSVAVYQNTKSSTEKHDGGWDKQMRELDSALVSRSIAVLQNDGKFKMNTRLNADSDSVIQISDDDDEENDGSTESLKCKVCDLQFATQKTLKCHMKSKHVESRVVFPCPDCLEIFSTTWSVYRHLFKVHRKTSAQVRRQRESIQAKAFKMNNIPAFYEKRKNIARQRAAQKLAQQDKLRHITEEERSDRENQEWMDSMEADGEGPRCGGCGRSFERRAALAAHTQTCAPRSRACAAATAANTKRIQIQIRRDYNKGPSLNKPFDANENKISEDMQSVADSSNTKDVTSRNDNVVDTGDSAELSRDSGESDDVPKSPEKSDLRFRNGRPGRRTDSIEDMFSMEDEAVVPDESNNVKQLDAEDQVILERQKVAVKEKESVTQDMPVPQIRLPNSEVEVTSNFKALRQKIEPDIDLKNILCKKCETQCATVQELFDHAAAHYDWKRYSCKLCPFNRYHFEKVTDHMIVVHKLNGTNDLYLSTIKALDGPAALEMCENYKELSANEISPDSRQTSRCSSESGRLSDDSSSSSTRIETGAKKRKINHNIGSLKRKKSSPAKNIEESSNDSSPADKDASIVENYTSNPKTFEENSSDMDELEDKLAKRQVIEEAPSMASRRPVRRKTKPKNEDFEYDLSNLLKKEAQGYRDSLTVTTTKSNQAKKKIPQENQVNYESLNKQCCGAMLSLAKNAVSKSTAHMKITSHGSCLISKDIKQSRLFIRPLTPKFLANGDKTSPKKDSLEEKKKVSLNIDKDLQNEMVNEDNSVTVAKEESSDSKKDDESSTLIKTKNITIGCSEPVKTNLHLPTVVPLKIRRQSMEVITNPLMNRKIKELKKTAMKKVLVIKPLVPVRQDVSIGINTSMQYQTIKLKDLNKISSCEDTPPVVVKLPKVECAVARPAIEASAVCKTPSVNADTSSESPTKIDVYASGIAQTDTSLLKANSKEDKNALDDSLTICKPTKETDVVNNCIKKISTDIC